MHSRSWNLGRFWECTGFDSSQLEIRYSTGNPTYKILSFVVTRALAMKLNSIWQNKERFRRRQTVHLLDANFAGNQLFWGSNLWHKYPCFPNYQSDLVSKKTVLITWCRFKSGVFSSVIESLCLHKYSMIILLPWSLEKGLYRVTGRRGGNDFVTFFFITVVPKTWIYPLCLIHVVTDKQFPMCSHLKRDLVGWILSFNYLQEMEWLDYKRTRFAKSCLIWKQVYITWKM